MSMKPAEEKSEGFDIVIIGGGINGAGIAREASAAGYSVCLCDAGDFGGGTSSASTKLIHGGLRYLEHFEFRLVREALKEREILWHMAPHIIWPMRFVLPHHRGLRPRWLLRLGLFLYDHLGGRKQLPATRVLNLSEDEAGAPLKPKFSRAFEYSDCWVEDSRLVILNLQDAETMGCSVYPRTRVTSATHDGQHWQIGINQNGAKHERHLSAKLVINAAGPWVDAVLQQVFGANSAQNIRLVRGSHIVVRRKFDHDRAYIFQNGDERIIFAIPYEKDYTLIGTTDMDHPSIDTRPEISPQETDYLCAMASEYFDEPVGREDIVWTYSGVRPLYNDGASAAQEATRDYVIKRDDTLVENGLINIFGGKLTTFRKLAFSVVGEIENILGKRVRRTDVPNHFPGGGFPMDGQEKLAKEISTHYPFLPEGLANRLTRHYGTRARQVLGAAGTADDLGTGFGNGLYACEVLYLMRFEWARTAEDIIYRRTKLGISMKKDQIRALQDFMDQSGIE